MAKILEKNNDYHVLFNIKDENDSNILLSYFSEYEVDLEDAQGTKIRTLKTTNTATDGKLYEYDTETLEFYLETRDSDANNKIIAKVKTKWTESKLSDGVFDNNKKIDEYIFQ